MASIYKFLGQEITLPNTANTVSNTTIVRLSNPSATAYLVTQKWTNTSIKASFTIVPYSELTVVKLVDDTLEANTGSDIKAVPVAYTN